jgi:hypothetical protein
MIGSALIKTSGPELQAANDITNRFGPGARTSPRSRGRRPQCSAQTSKQALGRRRVGLNLNLPKAQVMQHLAQQHHGGKHARLVGQVFLMGGLPKGLQHQAAEDLLHRRDMQQGRIGAQAGRAGDQAHIRLAGAQARACRHGRMRGLYLVFGPFNRTLQRTRVQAGPAKMTIPVLPKCM